MTNNQFAIILIAGTLMLVFIFQVVIPLITIYWKKKREYKRKCREYEKKLEKWGENVIKTIQNTPGGRLKEEKYRGG